MRQKLLRQFCPAAFLMDFPADRPYAFWNYIVVLPFLPHSSTVPLPQAKGFSFLSSISRISRDPQIAEPIHFAQPRPTKRPRARATLQSVLHPSSNHTTAPLRLLGSEAKKARAVVRGPRAKIPNPTGWRACWACTIRPVCACGTHAHTHPFNITGQGAALSGNKPSFSPSCPPCRTRSNSSAGTPTPCWPSWSQTGQSATCTCLPIAPGSIKKWRRAL